MHIGCFGQCFTTLDVTDNPLKDFSEGVRTMKLTKRYDDRIEGNLNVYSVVILEVQFVVDDFQGNYRHQQWYS